ncbi:MAG TPA: hypothetical protein VJS20_11540, partial [Gemmatimonadales bacterium]|nr:hypothetical protein [Gemmatimonadales bacterium]
MHSKHSFIVDCKSLLRAAVAALVASMTGAFAGASPCAAPTGFAQLEAEGAAVGSIHVDARDIFDVDDPRESNSLFRLVN